MLSRLGRAPEALTALERALAIRQRTLPPGHPRLGVLISNLGTLYRKQGDLTRSARLAEEAIAILSAALGPHHPNTARVELAYARTLAAQEERTRARSLFASVVRKLETALGPDHPDLALPLEDLAALLVELGDSAGAQSAWRRALAIREKSGDSAGAEAVRRKLVAPSAP